MEDINKTNITPDTEVIDNSHQPPEIPTTPIPTKPKNNMAKIIVIISIIVLAVIMVMFSLLIKNNKKENIQESDKKSDITVSSSLTPDEVVFNEIDNIYLKNENFTSNKEEGVVYWFDLETQKRFWESSTLTQPLLYTINIRLKVKTEVGDNGIESVQMKKEGYKTEITEEVNKVINLFNENKFSVKQIENSCNDDESYLITRNKTTCLIGLNYLNTTIPSFNIKCANQDNIDTVIKDEKLLVMEILKDLNLKYEEFQLVKMPSNIENSSINDEYALFNVGGVCSLETVLFKKDNNIWSEKLVFYDTPKCLDLANLKIPERIFSVCIDSEGKEKIVD